MDLRVLVSCDFHLSFVYLSSHASNLARVPNNCTCSVTFDTPSKHTKPTMTLFVLLLKYAHIRVIMTLLACRVMARVPVRSPFIPEITWRVTYVLLKDIILQCQSLPSIDTLDRLSIVPRSTPQSITSFGFPLILNTFDQRLG